MVTIQYNEFKSKHPWKLEFYLLIMLNGEIKVAFLLLDDLIWEEMKKLLNGGHTNIEWPLKIETKSIEKP